MPREHDLLLQGLSGGRSREHKWLAFELCARFVQVNSRAARRPMVESFVTGLLAWRGGQPGQVGNEAATAVFHQCRGSGSSPSFFCRYSQSTCLWALLVARVVLSGFACFHGSVSLRFLFSLLCLTSRYFSISSLAIFNEAGGACRYAVHSPLRAIVTDTISS